MTEGAISPSELKRLLDSGGPLALLDVREDDEREFGSIAAPPGVRDLHIRMGEVPSRVEEIGAVATPIVVYCHHGVRSRAVQLWLADRGVAGLLNLEGGIDAWSLRVDPSVPRYR